MCLPVSLAPEGDLKNPLPSKQHIFQYTVHIIGYSEGRNKKTKRGRFRELSLLRVTARAGLQHNDWSLRCLCGTAASCLRSSVSEGLALYGVEGRKWPWLLRGWLAAL